MCTSSDRGNADLVRQRLAGASLLIFANKQDIPGAKSVGELIEVKL